MLVLFDGLVQLLVGSFDRGEELGEGALGEKGEHFSTCWEGRGMGDSVVRLHVSPKESEGSSKSCAQKAYRMRNISQIAAQGDDRQTARDALERQRGNTSRPLGSGMSTEALRM